MAASNSGGLMGNLNDAIGSAMQSPLFALGTGLIAGAQPGANPGVQLQSAAQNQQAMALRNYQLAMMQQQMKFYGPILERLGGLMGAPSTDSNAPAGTPSKPSSRAAAQTARNTVSPLFAAPPVVGPYSAMPPNVAGAPQSAAPGAPSPAGMPQTAPASAPAAQSGMDPRALARFGLLASAVPFTQPMGKAAMQAAQIAMQTDPALATKMAAAKSAMAQDQALLAQAQQQGASPQFIQALQTRLKTDAGQLHIASMSGTTVQQNPDGSWTAFNPSSGLVTNTRTGAHLMAGAAAAKEAIQGAEARGEAQGEVEEVTDSNGNKFYVPRSALLGGGGGGGASSGTGGPTPFQAAVGPASAALLKGKGEQAVTNNDEYQQQAEAGQQMLAQITQLRSAANDFAPGQFADTRIKALQWLQSSGLITPEEMKRLGSAQEGTKISIQLQAAATKQLGSREAAQIFQIMGKSLPNLTLSPNGLSKVSAYMSGIARYNMARAQVSQQHFDGNDVNGVNDVRNKFIQNTNPTYYIVASASPAIQKEMIAAMGSKGRSFLENWQKAANAGWAPRPSQYAGQP